MLENLSRLSFRAYGELFPAGGEFFGVLPVGPDDKDIAEILSKHGNWQLRNQIPDFRRQMHRGVQLFFVAGDVTCHSSWDPIERRNQHLILTCEEFFTPYVYTTTRPDYGDVPFKIRVLRYYRHELQRMRGTWSNVDEVIEKKPSGWDKGIVDQPLREGVADVSGEEIPDEIRNAPFQLLWYEGWCKLPGQDDERYIKAVVDKHSRLVLLLQIHEEDNWQDVIRYEGQRAELDSYTQARQTYAAQAPMFEAARMQQDALQQQLALPHVDPNEAMAVQQAIAQEPIPAGPPPAPTWLEDPQAFDADMDQGGQVDTWLEPIRKEPIQMFAHGVCIEPLVGALGLSYGRILADFNRAANVALSQFTDSAHLANNWSLITPGIDFDGGFEISPGRINKAIGFTGIELKNSIVELKPAPANPQLLEVVDRMYSYGQTAAQAPNVLSGEPGKSGETYRGLAARLEQANKQLSVATQKYADFLEQVLKNNAKLNELYLRDEELHFINDDKLGTAEQIKVGRQMYRRDYRVEIRGDLRFTTMAQKIAEADEALQLVGMLPPLQQNPAYIYAALKNSLAARDQHDLIQTLGPPPPPPTDPMWLLPPGMVAPGVPAPPPPEQQQGKPAGNGKQEQPIQGPKPPPPQ